MTKAYHIDRRGMSDNKVAVRLTFRLCRCQHATPRFAHIPLGTAVCGGMQLMPGLPKHPAGERVDVDPETGRIVGLT